MPAAINNERKATILIDALYISDKEAAKKHGVSDRSIRNWKMDMENDPSFSAIFQKKLVERDKAWAEEIPAALNACIVFLKDAANAVRKNDPSAIEAITKAAQTLSEIAITREIIDARLTGTDRQNDKETG